MKRVCFLLILIVLSIFVFCLFNTSDEVNVIKSRGFLLVGTTGDYCPMSYFDSRTNSYVGFDIELAKDLANTLGVKVKFVPTTWKTLMKDTVDNKFDVAISGITITDERKHQALMSRGYLDNGKTVLCRKTDVNKYKDLESINRPDVRVIENHGGLNEKFAREHLPKANLIIHSVNYEIPHLIDIGKADVMITEVIEAKYYSGINKNLSAPLSDSPFTKGQIGMLIPKRNKKLLKFTNKFINDEIKSGRIKELKRKYIYCNLNSGI